MKLFLSLLCILVIVEPALVPNRPLLSIAQNAPKPIKIWRNKAQEIIGKGLGDIREQLPNENLPDEFWKYSNYTVQACIESAAITDNAEDFIREALSVIKARIESDGKTEIDEQIWKELNNSLQALPKDPEKMTKYFDDLLTRQNPGLGQTAISVLNSTVPVIVHNVTQVALAVPWIVVGVVTAPVRIVALLVIFWLAAYATQQFHESAAQNTQNQ